MSRFTGERWQQFGPVFSSKTEVETRAFEFGRSIKAVPRRRGHRVAPSDLPVRPNKEQPTVES